MSLLKFTRFQMTLERMLYRENKRPIQLDAKFPLIPFSEGVIDGNIVGTDGGGECANASFASPP